MTVTSSTRRRIEVLVAQKANLTVQEAAAYFNIGESKLRELTDGDTCPLVCTAGAKDLLNARSFKTTLINNSPFKTQNNRFNAHE